ncbi:MAG TPA: L-threonylcarbamoyladenylate synthase [Aestuariivirga sp.]|nr:L-threonylcarbamoyladenylate synthase [Aestuariivirga sp.]
MGATFEPEMAEVAAAAAALRRGDLVAFPTETVYGLGADATNDRAVAAIFAAKDRPSFNPLITHVATPDAAFALGDFPAEARSLGRAFWPGPLTLVVPRAAHCPVSLLASAGLPSLAIRVPAHPLALALLAAVGGPVVAPSANPSGRISPTTAEHVRQGLGGRVAVILDGGPAHVGLESTVVSFMGARPTLLRPGGLPREEIEDRLGIRLGMSEDDEDQPHSPGQLPSHYAPRAALRLNAEAPQADETYIGFGRYGGGDYTLSATGDLAEAAANLFRLLHLADAQGRPIAVAPVPQFGLGEAINDRLARAAAPRPTA